MTSKLGHTTRGEIKLDEDKKLSNETDLKCDSELLLIEGDDKSGLDCAASGRTGTAADFAEDNNMSIRSIGGGGGGGGAGSDGGGEIVMGGVTSPNINNSSVISNRSKNDDDDDQNEDIAGTSCISAVNDSDVEEEVEIEEDMSVISSTSMNRDRSCCACCCGGREGTSTSNVSLNKKFRKRQIGNKIRFYVNQ